MREMVEMMAGDEDRLVEGEGKAYLDDTYPLVLRVF